MNLGQPSRAKAESRASPSSRSSRRSARKKELLKRMLYITRMRVTRYPMLSTSTHLPRRSQSKVLRARLFPRKGSPPSDAAPFVEGASMVAVVRKG